MKFRAGSLRSASQCEITLFHAGQVTETQWLINKGPEARLSNFNRGRVIINMSSSHAFEGTTPPNYDGFSGRRALAEHAAHCRLTALPQIAPPLAAAPLSFGTDSSRSHRSTH